MPDPAPLRLTVAADLDGLSAAQDRIAAHLAARGASARTRDRAALVVEEVVMNVAMHGHDDPGPHAVEIALEVADGGVTLLFEDRARPFDPAHASLPDLPARLEDATPGGLGLTLLRRMSDGLAHAPREGGGNRLTVTLRER